MRSTADHFWTIPQESFFASHCILPAAANRSLKALAEVIAVQTRAVVESSDVISRQIVNLVNVTLKCIRVGVCSTDAYNCLGLKIASWAILHCSPREEELFSSAEQPQRSSFFRYYGFP